MEYVLGILMEQSAELENVKTKKQKQIQNVIHGNLDVLQMVENVQQHFQIVVYILVQQLHVKNILEVMEIVKEVEQLIQHVVQKVVLLIHKVQRPQMPNVKLFKRNVKQMEKDVLKHYRHVHLIHIQMMEHHVQL